MSKIERGTRRLKPQILLPLEHKVGLLRLRQLVHPFNLSSTHTIDHLLTPMLVTTQLVSQQPHMPQDSTATKRNSRLTSRFRPQPLSMVPEVLSTSSTPNPFMSRAASTTVSGLSKGTTEKSYFKPSQTEHEPRSGEESRDSNDGPWSSLDDAGDVQDAKDEASCGRAGSNDVPDSDHMSENAGPHELDDELGQGGQTPSPQVHSQQSSSQQQFPQPRVHTQSIVSSQHAPSQQYVPWHAVSLQSGPAPAQQPMLQQSRLSRPQVAPECAPAPPPPHCPNQHGESISSHQSGMLQDRGVRSNNGPQMRHGEEVGMDYDVNARHQSRNHRPCPPSPTYLKDTVSSEKHPSKKLRSNVVSQVQGRLHSEEDCSGDSMSLVSERRAFFGPLWCKLLGEAKARMRLYVAMEVPFLRREMAIDGVCMEILVEMVIKYEDDGLELEAGFYPEHKRSMATILFNDMQTFHSEIKKVTVCIVPFEYGLYPPKTIDDNAKRIDFIKKKATQLLESARYLHGDLDSLGRTSNFAHSTLKKTCLAVYYCTSSKSLRQFAKFQESVPVKVLALVAAIIQSILTTFKKHGVAKNETLCGDEIEEACNNIMCLIDQVWYDNYHGSKLNKML
ncbi:hypothetical protein PISMIDRAFT_7662 [Pisolithus microcarpus 441]|uniref:DUF6532 domain-containing protein n=1 Tax=Pisolithus microcarpus 441 TaxID=765257 RepID=A0A0D0A7U3_9AGAM|nr:hypothetical protein BKA83DRAFT_7662 [Pisolithus microcarpus]KIK28133.1 hypothetical protein PISMIDRAFT_7662 [Pisolithus microcarpus 441]